MKVRIKGSIRLPKVTLQDELMHVAERIIIPIMADNISKGKALDGQVLPALEPATIKRKGHGRPLIETGKLRRSFIAKRKGKYAVLITLVKDRKDIGGYLQIDGVGKKKKKFNFFGVSTVMERLAMQYMEKQLKRRIRNA